ncbi:MAG: pyruvate ferredoxin oxidoreductase [Candidatus Omnitrophota bacterium]
MEPRNAMQVMDGNSAAAEAIKQVKPDVMVAHPVSSAAAMLEKIASFTANGCLGTEFVNVESWPSAMGCCIGASTAGGRVFTVTDSLGLAQMHAMLRTAASLRLPIVLGIADPFSTPDCGWIQLFCDDPQEIYDNVIQAFRIAEHLEIRLPVMVHMEGEMASQTQLLIEADREIDSFVGKFTPTHSIIDTDLPPHTGAFDVREADEPDRLHAFENARAIIREVGKEFGDRFGRYYAYFDSYKLEDADVAIVVMNPGSQHVKEAVKHCRDEGERVGLLKLRVFRPFPYPELRERLRGLTAITVIDRTVSPGMNGGTLFNEIRSALYDCPESSRPAVFSFISGTHGHDLGVDDFKRIFKEMITRPAKNGKEERER